MTSPVFNTPLQREASLPSPWPVPLPGSVALSVDGSFRGDDGSAAASMVIRDTEGQVLFAAYQFIFHCNEPLEAELDAIMQGMALAIQHSNLSVVLQSDLSEALSSLSNDAFVRGAYGQ